MVRLKKLFFVYFRIAVSLVLIGWLVHMANASELATTLSRANLLLIGVMALMANLDRMLMAYKWRLLLTSTGIQLPLLQAISAYYKATFWGSLFLPTIGADTVRILEVSRQTKRSEDIISSVVMERAIGMIALALVGVLSLGLFITYVSSTGWKILIQLSLVLVLVVMAFVFTLNRGWLTLLSRRLGTSRWKVVGKLSLILASYERYARQRRALALFMLLTVAEQFFPVMNNFLIAKALNIDIPFIFFVIFIPLVTAAVRLPLSFDGFGPREGLSVYLFGLVGIPQTQSFLFAFMTAIIARFATAPLTLYFFLWHRSSTSTINIASREQLALKE